MFVHTIYRASVYYIHKFVQFIFSFQVAYEYIFIRDRHNKNSLGRVQ